MRNIVICTVVVLMLQSTIAFAQPIQDIPVGDDKIVVVTMGDKVPFSGQLFDPATATRWGNWLLQYKYRLAHDLETQKKIDQVEIDYKDRILKLEREKYILVTKDYQGTIADQQKLINSLDDEVRNPPFYRSVWFGVVIGAVAMGTAVGLAAYGLSSVK